MRITKPKISFILPGYKINYWMTVLQSLQQFVKSKFELIIVSPFPAPQEFMECDNVKFIRDFGSPVRAVNVGFSLAEGKLISILSDDWHATEKLEHAINLPNKIIIGQLDAKEPFISSEKNYFDFRYPFIMSAELFKKIGQLNCVYETLHYALKDLGRKAQEQFKDDIHYVDLNLFLKSYENSTMFSHKCIRQAKISDEKNFISMPLHLSWDEVSPIWNRRHSPEKTNKPYLSIIMPAFRKENFSKVYNSICKSTKRSFELIIVGPYAPEKKLLEIQNIKFVKDYGNPVRCSNIGALLAEGEILTWTADDAVYYENSIDENLSFFEEMEYNEKNVLIGKYLEGQQNTEKKLYDDKYYLINSHDSLRLQIPNNWFIFNIGFMYRKFFEQMGGWDCDFEATAMAHSDFAIRCQQAGAICKLSPIVLTDTDQQPGLEGDHYAVHNAQVESDEKLYRIKYSNPNWRENIEEKLNNWKRAEMIWSRRFKSDKNQ